MEEDPRQEYWIYLVEWCNRMSKMHGSIVYDKNGDKLDWGQAICREWYGENWKELVDDNIPIEQLKKVVKRADEWEKGSIPDWVDIK